MEVTMVVEGRAGRRTGNAGAHGLVAGADMARACHFGVFPPARVAPFGLVPVLRGFVEIKQST